MLFPQLRRKVIGIRCFNATQQKSPLAMCASAGLS
jgi:hypothetical protein